MKKTGRIFLVLVFLLVAGLIKLAIFSSPTEIVKPADKPKISSPTPYVTISQPSEPATPDNNPQPEPITPTPEPVQASKKPVTVNFDPSTPTFVAESGEVYPLRTYQILAPNDPSANQWWTTSTGLNTAWNIGAGARQTVVAIIDTGFALKHEEFTNRWATNTSEQGATVSQAASKLNCTARGLALNQSCNLIDDNYDGIVDNESGATTVQNPSKLNCTDQAITLDKSCNMIDDDNNGYVDDVTGWDFANFDSNVQAGETNPDGTGTMHGTEVAGVLGATGNNSKGIAGVNWATKILPLQAIDDDSSGNTLTVARAVYYAADRGVDVISMSVGSASEDPYLRQAIQYALSKNIIVVAASGNDGCDCMLYPARYPEVFAVGSHNSSNIVSSFSSYGDNLDILAPGENIRSTTWTKTNPTNSYISGIAGTSFATPYVSGLLSLARSHQPNASWGELTNILQATANHTGLSFNNPSSPSIGSGYTMASNLINRVTTPATPLMRYNFGSTAVLGTLSSNRTYQCFSPADFPTAPLYRISLVSSIFYTIDTLEAVKAPDLGYTVSNLGRTCVGLPGDNPSNSRTINLLTELDNKTVKNLDQPF